jgi:hypothetical protein
MTKGAKDKAFSISQTTPLEYIEKELAKIRSPGLPMWSASTLA